MKSKIIVVMIIIWLTTAIPALASTPTPVPPTPTGDAGQFSTIIPPAFCGSIFTPCGSVPWPIITLQPINLPSPNPIIISALTGSGTPTQTPVPTQTPIPSLDLSNINTLSAMVGTQQSDLATTISQPILIDGTPTGPAGIGGKLGAYVGNIFGIARSLQLGNFFGIGGAIGFILLVIAWIIFVQFSTFLAPIIIALIRLILQIITALKPF